MDRRAFLKGLGLFGVLLVTGCGSLTKTAESVHAETASANGKSGGNAGGKILIAYYSQKGHTRAAAQRIQALTGGELFEIKPADPYPEDHDPCLDRQLKEIESNARPALAAKVENIGQYDTVFIGYPIWYYQAPMVLNTFVEQHNLAGKTIMPFCTSGGFGVEQSVEVLKKLAPQGNWQVGLRVTGDDDKLKAWLKKIG